MKSIRPLLIHGETLGRLYFTVMGMIFIRPHSLIKGMTSIRPLWNLSDPSLYRERWWAESSLLSWGWSPSDPYYIHQTPICNHRDDLHQTPTISIRPLLIHGEMLGRLKFTNMGMISIRPLLDPWDFPLYSQGWPPSDPYNVYKTPPNTWRDVCRLKLTDMGMISIRPLLDPSDPTL